MGQYRPSFNDLTSLDKKKVDVEQLERVFRIVFDRLYETPTSIEQAILEAEKKLPSLIRENAEVIQRSLQADGNAPLNLTSLPGIPAQVSQIIQDTHANRIALYPAANYPNTVFWETDRLVLYVSEAGTWKYVSGVNVNTFSNRPADLGTGDVGFQFYASDFTVGWRWSGTAFEYRYGIYERTQAQLAALAALLAASDVGFLVDVTDYEHILKWTGTAWSFQAGDGSGHVVMGKPDGSAPNGGVWGLCDGTAYTVLNGVGTTSNLTTQNLTGEVFLKGATAVAGQQAAVRATWEVAAITDNASAGTPAGSIGNNDSSVAVQSGAGTTVAADPHSHSFTGSAMGNHQHALSDANAQLKVPSEANGGLPLRISTVWYIRR